MEEALAGVTAQLGRTYPAIISSQSIPRKRPSIRSIPRTASRSSARMESPSMGRQKKRSPPQRRRSPPGCPIRERPTSCFAAARVMRAAGRLRAGGLAGLRVRQTRREADADSVAEHRLLRVLWPRDDSGRSAPPRRAGRGERVYEPRSIHGGAPGTCPATTVTPGNTAPVLSVTVP